MGIEPPGLLNRSKAVIGRATAMLLIAAIQLYRYSLSYFLGRQCRFAPSCSEYALLAIRQHGPIAGAWLALKRVSRCHPWGPSGFDPVPPAAEANRRDIAARRSKGTSG